MTIYVYHVLHTLSDGKYHRKTHFDTYNFQNAAFYYGKSWIPHCTHPPVNVLTDIALPISSVKSLVAKNNNINDICVFCTIVLGVVGLGVQRHSDRHV